MSNPIDSVLAGAALIAIIAFCTDAKADVWSTCMDSHGSTYTWKSDTCPDVTARNMTPEYMYTDRATQQLQMILNQRTVQAEANIARAGTPLPSSNTTILSNEQDQSQSSRSNSNANSNSRSNASNSNSNTNNNINTNSQFTGIFN